MLVPIACRFVPYDQWFLTHLDDASKVKQIKLWFLSKCNLVQSSRQIQRPVSPITFAPTIRSRSPLESVDDGYYEDDEYSDREVPPRHPAPSTPGIHSDLDAKLGMSSQSVHPGSSQYTLLSFSTGSILEDEFTLSWYNLHPYELLEMHPVGIVAPLRRDVLAEYIQPYFLAKVRVLRAVWNHTSGRFEAPGIGIEREQRSSKAKDKLAYRLETLSSKSSTSHSEKGCKIKLDWKARWVVISRGVLSLCKEHATSPPLHQFALSTMRALRGANALERALSIVTQPRVVCIKFRPCPSSLTGVGVVSPPSSSPSSPISEKGNAQEPLLYLDSASDLRRTTEQGWSSGEYTQDTNDAWREEGEWIILDMLDDHAFSSILRVLHRQAAHPISSSFVGSPSIITVSHHPISSLDAAPFALYDTIPYPEWRVNTVENARQAGVGDVGKPMAWVLWTEKSHGETMLGNIRRHRKAFSRTMQYKAGTVPSDTRGSDDESDEDSEMEWEGWMRDLERQSRVKERLERASRSAVSREVHITPGMSSPLPSPLSEASSSDSPRVRPPSMYGPHVGIGSYSHVGYPNIGNLAQVGGTHGSCSPEKKIQGTIVSRVSVGMAPASRRRSSTLSAELVTGTKRDHDKGKQDKERFPRLAEGAARAPDGMRWSSVRHSHSSSNLRMPSPLYGSDAAASTGRPGPSSPPKRQSAFMRGMSLRAGKIVRGLESAIDFVDEKNV